MKEVTTVNIVQQYINYESYICRIGLDNETSSLVYNGAVNEVVVTSSVDKRKEVLEKVCIDSDSNDGDDTLTNNDQIVVMQQLQAADEIAGNTEFKMASKKWCIYGNCLSNNKCKIL